MCEHIYTHTQVCVSSDAYGKIYTCIYLRYIDIYKSIHTYIYVCVNIYPHTHRYA